MYFNQMGGNPWAAFSSFMGAFAGAYSATNASSWNSQGPVFGGQTGLPQWLSNALMRHFDGGMEGCWGQGRRHGYRHQCSGDGVCTTATPVQPPVPTPLPAPAPAPAPAATAPVAAPSAPVINAPKEGSWSSAANGFMVGQTGEVQVRGKDFASCGANQYPVQYRATDGTWTTLGTGADLERKGTVMIKAKPGDKVEFRVLNTHNMDYLSMTTGNTPLHVFPSSDGAMIGALGFKLYLSDPNAKG